MRASSFSAALLGFISLSILGACSAAGQGTSGAGGAGAATSAATTGASTTGASTSSGTGGTGGTGGMGGAGGMGSCSSMGWGLLLQGELDGQPVSAGYSSGPMLFTPTLLEMAVGTGGLFYLDGGQALLLFPPGGPLADHVIFASSATFTDLSFELSSMVDFGACPAASGTGDLAYCFDSPGGCPGGMDTTTTGSVNGTAFDWGGDQNQGALTTTALTALVTWANGAVLFAAHDGSSVGGVISGGFLWMPPSGPDAGAVWCVGSGSLSGMEGDVQIQIAGLTRLGPPASFPTATGSIAGCF